MKIQKIRLSNKTIEEIKRKVILEKKISQFIADADINNGVYYMAVNGGKIKPEYEEKIISTLEKY